VELHPALAQVAPGLGTRAPGNGGAEEGRTEVRLFRQNVSRKPQVVTICCSTRFAAELAHWRKLLTKYGYIVLGPEIVTTERAGEIRPELKSMLDELHLRKIDLADWVLVLNLGKYVDPNTNRQVEYCLETGKHVAIIKPVCMGDVLLLAEGYGDD